MSIEHDSWAVERDYPHRPARVYAAWAEPAVKIRWFDLSGDPAPDHESDFRVGGAETLRTAPGVRARYVYSGHYRDLVAGERIVLTDEVSVEGRLASVSVATVHFGPTAGGTRLAHDHESVPFDPATGQALITLEPRWPTGL